MIISAVLSLLMLGALGIGIVARRRSPAVATALVLVSALGLVFVWTPDALTHIANRVGVGRGTDLVLYLWTAISFLVMAALAVQLRHLHAKLTEVVRRLALMQARQDHPLPFDSTDGRS